MRVRESLLEEIEMRLVLEGVRDSYGFDFRAYDPAWLRPWLWEREQAGRRAAG